MPQTTSICFKSSPHTPPDIPCKSVMQNQGTKKFLENQKISIFFSHEETLFISNLKKKIQYQKDEIT